MCPPERIGAVQEVAGLLMDTEAWASYAACWIAESMSGEMTVTEQEWLACTDPTPMLEFLRGKVSDRKLRLFACACCRKVWHLLPDERSRKAVEVAEAYTDGLTSQEVVEAMRQAAWDAYKDASTVPGRIAAWNAMQATAENSATAALCITTTDATGAVQPHFLRDIFGSPFRSAPTHPFWLHCSDGTILRLAQAIYDERAFDRLPILADALEEAGCQDQDILAHCRSGDEHVRGCWVIDALLGKS